IPAADRWWIWTCAAGTGIGLFGLVYVPRLKRSREHAAQHRARSASAARYQAGHPASEQAVRQCWPPSASVAVQRLEDGIGQRHPRRVHQVITELVDDRRRRTPTGARRDRLGVRAAAVIEGDDAAVIGGKLVRACAEYLAERPA